MALNVGSGKRTSVLEVARAVVDYYNADVPISVTGAYRVGDIRHNVADISRISSLTDFAPKWGFAEGLKAFLDWANTHEAADAGFDRSLQELSERQLLKTGKSH